MDSLLLIPAGNSDIVVDGLEFEAGVTVPDEGVSSQGGDSFITIGSTGSSATASRIAIRNCHFGVNRYSTNGPAYDIWVKSSFDNLAVHDNYFDTGFILVYFVSGHSTQQYVYRGFTFQNNQIAFSRSRSTFGSVLNLGEGTSSVYARLERTTITGNNAYNVNGNFDIPLGGSGLVIANNTVWSDNVDAFSFLLPPVGQTMSGVVYSGNTCTAPESSGDPNKLSDPWCILKVQATNVAVTGNTLTGTTSYGGLIEVLGAHINVSNNVLDPGATTAGYGQCIVARGTSYSSFTGNTCRNAGTRAFSVWGSGGEVHDLTFTDNQLFTTVGTAIASNFIYFDVTASDVTIRDNRIWGQNLTGSFLGGSAVTRLNSVGNQESIQETGWRIGSDQILDITGTGLTVSSGALGVSTIVTVDAEWDTTTKINSATSDDDFLTVNGNQSVANKSMTSTTNAFPTLGLVTFIGAGATGGTTYFGMNRGAAVPTESGVQTVVPQLTAAELRCHASVTPATSKTWTLRLRKNGGDTVGLGDCIITSAGPNCSASGLESFGADDLISLRVTASGTPASSTLSCALRVGS